MSSKRLMALLAALFLTGASAWAEESAAGFPTHEPYGTGIGVMPGRVVWTHDPSCVSWEGDGFWWEIEHFREDAISQMVNRGIAALAGEEDPSSGWAALFTSVNERRGRSGGYLSGERIAIKVNMNGSGVFDDSTDTRMSTANAVLLRALLLSLVTQAGVSPECITVYDASRVIPTYMMELCGSGVLAGVRFEYRDVLGKNDAKPDMSAPIRWSQAFSGEQSFLPTCVTEAAYLINLANLKGHSYGVTLCAKNHFGTLMNSDRLRPPEAANLHQFLTRDSMAVYSVLVDLMGNAELGGKTVLYMLDAILCATSEGASMTGENTRWQQPPFDGCYPASLFFSQDPVAIDSVGVDFLMNEPAVLERNGALRGNPTVENYLHEAGLVSSAPSGTTYQNGQGEPIVNLGVHEHWNNPVDKQYSRNLGRSEGIELVALPMNEAAEKPGGK
ncbi:MAG: DUF362 domain-containing protein [Aristaeellaceae bacterium]